MSSTFQKTFTGISLAFGVFCIIYFFVLLSVQRESNVRGGTELLQSSYGYYSRRSSADSFLESMEHGNFGRSAPLLYSGPVKLILVYNASGILELYSTNDEYLSQLPKDLSMVRGEPIIRYNDISEELVSVEMPNYRFAPGDGNSAHATLSAVIQVLGPEDLRPIGIQMLYTLVGFAMFTLLYFIIALIADPKQRERDMGFEYVGGQGSQDAQTAGTDRKNTKNDEIRPPDAPQEEADSVPGETESSAPKEEQGPSPWPIEFFQLRLNNEIERAAEQENDLCFVVFRLGKIFAANADSMYRFEQLLISFFRYEDMIFRLDDQYFGLILPDHDENQGLKQIEAFFIHANQKVPDVDELYAGYSTRSARLLDGQRLMKEAMKAASLASDSRGKIIGFRPDPNKYQKHLMSHAKLKRT